MNKSPFIPYFRPQECDLGTISIDMITVKGKVIHSEKQRLANYLSHKSELLGWKVHANCTQPLRYRDLVEMTYGMDGKVPIKMICEIGFNDISGKITDAIRLELNPNKLFDKRCNLNAEEAKKDYRRILDACRGMKVIEYDIALDMPLERQMVTIMPNHKRTYMRINGKEVKATDDKAVQANADDYTQYVGQRHTNGYTKVYNKQLERGLPDPITRAEITIRTEEYKKDFGWTKIYYKPRGDDKQLGFGDIKKQSEEDRFIAKLLAILQVPSEQIHTLKSRKLIKKYESLILDGYKELDLRYTTIFDNRIAHIQDFVNDKIFAEIPQDIEFNEDRFKSRCIYLRQLSKKQFVPYETIRETSDEAFNKAVIFFAQLEGISLEEYSPYAYDNSCTPTAPATLKTGEFFACDMETPFD